MRASYLKTRTRTQHFRLRIPSDLVPVFGRAEIHRSTRTSDRPQARQIARALRARWFWQVAPNHLPRGAHHLRRDRARCRRTRKTPTARSNSRRKIASLSSYTPVRAAECHTWSNSRRVRPPPHSGHILQRSKPKNHGEDLCDSPRTVRAAAIPCRKDRVARPDALRERLTRSDGPCGPNPKSQSRPMADRTAVLASRTSPRHA